MAVGAWALYSSAYEIPGPEFPAPTAMIWLDMAEVVNGHGSIATNVLPTAIAGATASFGRQSPRGPTIMLVLVPCQKFCTNAILLARAVGAP